MPCPTLPRQADPCLIPSCLLSALSSRCCAKPCLFRSSRIRAYPLRCFSPPVQSKHRRSFSGPVVSFRCVSFTAPIGSSRVVTSPCLVSSHLCHAFPMPSNTLTLRSNPLLIQSKHRVALALQLVSFHFLLASPPIRASLRLLQSDRLAAYLYPLRARPRPAAALQIDLLSTVPKHFSSNPVDSFLLHFCSQPISTELFFSDAIRTKPFSRSFTAQDQSLFLQGSPS